MKDLIKLNSRDKSENYLKKLIKKGNFESLTYILKTDSSYIRTGKLNNGSERLSYCLWTQYCKRWLLL